MNQEDYNYGTISNMPRSMAACAARESSRYGINAIKVVQRNGKTFAVVTDGRLLVVSEVECDPAESADIGVGMIPASLLNGGGSAAHKLEYCGGEWRNLSTKRYDDEADGHYPPFEKVIPDPREYMANGGRVVLLNARFLKAIADVTSPDDGCVALILPVENSKPICVVGESGRIGVLMQSNPTGESELDRFCHVRDNVISEKSEANATNGTLDG